MISKRFLKIANGTSTFFVNGKAILANEARKLSNPPTWLLVFLVVPFNKIPLFPKDPKSFILLFVKKNF